jgi:hypothetical protein
MSAELILELKKKKLILFSPKQILNNILIRKLSYAAHFCAVYIEP